MRASFVAVLALVACVMASPVDGEGMSIASLPFLSYADASLRERS